ncbi:MAG: hypothetical protein KatS3mg114_0902 [Planctomycetaceae bacterium]|nr:MAG: hypothetical protein KatS3mg114_0902 [Planctomycetaceae bacterium]
MEAYTESPATWRRSRRSSRPTTSRSTPASGRPTPATWTQLPPGGEIKHGSAGTEATYRYPCDTFAKHAEHRPPRHHQRRPEPVRRHGPGAGPQAMRSLSDLVYKVLLANAATFFSAANGNYDAGAATALSSASLAAGIARMLAQRDAEERDLDIRPRALLVPPELAADGQGAAPDRLHPAGQQRPAHGQRPEERRRAGGRAEPVQQRSFHRHEHEGLVLVRRARWTRPSSWPSSRATRRRRSSSSASTPTRTCWRRRGGFISTTVPPSPTTAPPTRQKARPEPPTDPPID